MGATSGQRLLSLFEAVTRYRELEGHWRDCFLAAATELPEGDPGRPWLQADVRLLLGRLSELAGDRARR